MPTNRSFPQILGELSVSAGEHRLSIEGTPGRIILRVNSMGTLVEIRKTVSRLLAGANGNPKPPVSFTGVPEAIIALGSRPIARVELSGGSPKVIPTPLKAITSRV